MVKGGAPGAPTPLAGASAGSSGPLSARPSNGPELIAYVTARYPERLAAGVSGEQRLENVLFLRDRIIEIGRCGGMLLGWNLKRGGPEKSVDFIAWRQAEGDRGVDIALDYDNTSRTLQLQWAEWPDFGASYAAYPDVPCR